MAKAKNQKLWILADRCNKAITYVTFSRSEARSTRLEHERIFPVDLTNNQVKQIVDNLNR